MYSSRVISKSEAVEVSVVNDVVTVLNAVSGPQGPPGPMPIVGHVYEQSSPSAVWTITHPLPFYPNVTVFDSSGSQVIGDITFGPQYSPFTITFSAAFSGSAYLS